MKINLKGFEYAPDPDFLKYLKSIFDGEYDVPFYMKSPRILDVGANIGAFAIWATHRWPGATVYAYEPNPEVYKHLEENVDRTNSVGIVPIDFGVGIEGKRVYRQGRHNIGEGGFYNDPGWTDKPEFELFVKSPLIMPSANILKIDTEGCEVEILYPLIQDGRRFDAIMMEFHREKDRQMLEKMLAKDYFLINYLMFNAHRGVMKFMHRDWLEEIK